MAWSNAPSGFRSAGALVTMDKGTRKNKVDKSLFLFEPEVSVQRSYGVCQSIDQALIYEWIFKPEIFPGCIFIPVTKTKYYPTSPRALKSLMSIFF